MRWSSVEEVKMKTCNLFEITTKSKRNTLVLASLLFLIVNRCFSFLSFTPFIAWKWSLTILYIISLFQWGIFRWFDNVLVQFINQSFLLSAVFRSSFDSSHFVISTSMFELKLKLILKNVYAETEKTKIEGKQRDARNKEQAKSKIRFEIHKWRSLKNSIRVESTRS